MRKNCFTWWFRIIIFAVSCFGIDGHAQNWVAVGRPGFTGDTSYPWALAINNAGTPYVAFQDSCGFTGPGLLSVMKFNDTSWVYVGNPGFSGSAVNNMDLVFDRTGTPFVSYCDFATGYKVTVKKFAGTSWVTVGTAGFSDTMATFISMAIGRNDTPYVAYAEGATGDPGQATVKKFNGLGWVTVGTRKFTPGASWFAHLAIDTAGRLYVCCQDSASGLAGGRALVVTYDGTGWIDVGVHGFSAGSAWGMNMALDPAGTPYVTYRDGGNGDRTTVMKYNGSGWVNVGAPGFSSDVVASTDIAIDQAGVPYVAYQEQVSGSTMLADPTTVKKYNGTDWIAVGDTNFSTGYQYGARLALNRAGAPYVAYQDSANSYRLTVITIPPVCAITGDSIVCIGDAATILADTCRGGAWSTSDTAIATVGAGTGVVKGIVVGTAIISYTLSGTVSTKIVYVTNCTVNNGIRATQNQASLYLNVFPNPIRGSFSVTLLSAADESAQVTITNMLGEKIKEVATTTNKPTELKLNVPSGIYFISAIVKNETITEKIVAW